jgi:two-component system sensor histidine kinase YesM
VKGLSRPRLTIGQKVFVTSLGIVATVLLLTSIIYFAIFSRTSDALVESQSREINKQIVFNYENYIDSVIETANYVQFAASKLDVVADARELDELYEVNAAIKKDVVAIFLFDASGRQVVGVGIRLGSDAIRRSNWFRSALRQPDIFHFTADGSRTLAQRGDSEVVFVSRVVEFVRDGAAVPGILLIELDIGAVTDLAERTNLGEGGHILIIDEGGELVYTSELPEGPYTSDSLALSSERYLGGFAADVAGTAMYLNVNTLARTRWRIVTVNNIDGIRLAQVGVVRILALVFLGSVGLAAAVAAIISIRISDPIRELERMMERVEEGDFTTTVMVSGQREIVALSESFSRMVYRVRELMDRLVSQQKEKQKTELRALQNQINPHFLYNTLDSIVWLAEHGRTEDVITTVVALARFFRISISKGRTFIPVSDEISHVESFLTIQRTRYVDRFRYDIDIDQSMQDCLVMKLILQPLVENAIYHGMGDETGTVTIRGRRIDGVLVFEVTNTGYGVTDAKIAEIYETMRGDRPGGVGIRNVYRRLKLYYGDAADVGISSVLDESTTVTLRIPDTGEGGAE